MIRTLNFRPALSLVLPAVMTLLFHACAPEAPNIDLSATGGTVPGSAPGTEYLQVESIYPDAPLPATDRFPVDTDVVIMFSKPVQLADINAANIVIAPAGPAFGAVTSFAGGKGVRIPFVGMFAFNTTYTITINPTAINDSGGVDFGIAGPNDAAEFTTGLDTTLAYDPVVIAATRYPIGAGPYSRSVGYVVASFNKEVQNVTAATFTIAPAAASGAPYFSPDQKTWYLPLNVLTYGQVYTIVLDDIPPGIRDLGLRELVPGPNNTWTFTVEADPSPGGPITISSVWVTEVTDTSVRVHWSTTRPATGFTVRYGITTAYGSNVPELGTPTVHYADIIGLNHSTKYYFIIDHATIVTQTGSFITGNDPNPAVNDHRLNALAAGPPAANISEFTVHQNTDGTAYVAWVDGTTVRATYFNVNGTPNVNWHPGQSVDNAHGLSDPRLFADGYGGVFVAMEDGASGFYVKYVTGGAGGITFSTLWGDNTAAGFGNTFGHVANYQNPNAITMFTRYGAGLDNNVYNGFVSRVHDGTGAGTTHNIPANPFYDFDVDLRDAVIQNNDRIMNVTTHTGAVATRSTNFRHVLGQSAALVAAGNVYRIADGVASFTNFTTANHAMNVTPPLQTNLLDRVITQHNYGPPAWMGVDDVIQSGATYVYINAFGAVNQAADYSGTERPDVLFDPFGNFIVAGVIPTDIAINISVGPPVSYARVTDVYDDMLALDNGTTFLHTGDHYDIYRFIDEGVADADTVGSLQDSGSPDWTFLVAVDDWVVNVTANTYGQVTAVMAHELTVTGVDFTTGDTYLILEDPPIISNGTEQTLGVNPLVDHTAAWTAGIVANAYVINTDTLNTTYLSLFPPISDRILNLSADIFNSDNYSIYNNHCTTHPANAIDPFYRMTVDLGTFNVGNGVLVDVYNYRGITGTADTPPANPLYDDNALFITGGGLRPPVNNDVVVNVTDTAIARVNTGAFAVHERALDITGAAGFMSDADRYWILRFNTPAETWSKYGKATALSAGLISAGANFDVAGVETGDLVYNISDHRFAVVVSRDSPTQLTLTKSIFDTGNEDYLVFASTEPLVATGTISATAGLQFTDGDMLTNFQLAAYPVYPGDVLKIPGIDTVGIVSSVDSANQITLRAAIPGWAPGQTYYIYRQRVFFAWEDGGRIRSATITMGNGSVHATTNIYVGADTMRNMKLLHANGNGGGARMIYEDATDGDIYYKRVDSFGTVVLGAADNGTRGIRLYAGAAARILDVQLAPDNPNFRFLVLYRDGANVYLARYDSATGALADWGINPITFANAVAAVMAFDAANNPIVAYADNLGRIYAEKFTIATGVQTNFGTLLDIGGTGSYVSNLSIASDRLDGAIVSWMDNRYYYGIGYAVMAHAIVPGGPGWTFNWLDDVADEDGVLIGIVSTWDATDLFLKGLYYNDGGTPYGGNFLWKDYRNAATATEADIFYDVRANP